MHQPGLPPLQVNVSRWSQLFRKLGVVKGDDIVSEVHRQIFPVIIVEDDRPEHKLLAGERLAFGQYLLAAAGAGEVGHVGIRNPAGSSIIVVVEQARYVAQIGAVRRVYLSLARAATLTIRSTEQPRDTRLQPIGVFGTAAPGIAGQIVSGITSTIAVTPFPIAELAAGFVNPTAALSGFCRDAIWTMPVVLAPGDTLLFHLSDGIGGTLANEPLECSFVWRERATEPGETV